MTRTGSVVIVGGGHNGLTAAAYLARAGVRVTLLERLPQLGGAAISAPAFPGVGARLSRYSYLVSLLPQRIIDDLGLDVWLVRRRYSSYTPVPGTDRGLLVDTGDAEATRASFARVGAAADADAFRTFSERTSQIARSVFPTLTGQLPTSAEARALFGDAWDDFCERPIGDVIRRSVQHDLVRGVLATDALIGTFASVDDESLDQNRCLLYHVIGGGTGDWDVPVGGMGHITGELERVARDAGADLRTNCTVTSLSPDGDLTWTGPDGDHTAHGDLVLCGVAAAVVGDLLGEPTQRPEGAQVKVNLLLRHLPHLADPTVSTAAAFGGTFHVNESLTQLEDAHTAAFHGRLPDPLPLEIYCHSLADPSILESALVASGHQSLTVFGLHVPHRLTVGRAPTELRDDLERAVLASLDSVLGEALGPSIARDATGRPCLEVKTTADLEDALAMPGGHIFHGPLSWPWAADEPLETPAQRWGVATAHPRILLCGAGARRGGGVSGVGGHNAAHAALEQLSR